MEEDIAGRCHSVVLTANLTERMQIFRFGQTEEPVPSRGAEPHDAQQIALEVTEADRAQKRGQIGTQASHGCFIVLPHVDC